MSQRRKWFFYRYRSSAGGYYLIGGGHVFLNLFLLIYRPGDYNPAHYDHFKGQRHIRFNLRLWGEDTFRTAGRVYLKLGPLVIFDAGEEHEAVPSKRWRVLLSFGVVV